MDHPPKIQLYPSSVDEQAAAGSVSPAPLASPGSAAHGRRSVEIMEPGSFEPVHHFYPRVLNAQIHPLVRSFLNLGNSRIAKRYCHLHPDASSHAVSTVLRQPTRYFQWGGADLFSTTSTERAQKRLVVVETNSCPSGQKSMPLVGNEDSEQHAGYRTLLEKSFMPTVNSGKAPDGRPLPDGALAVLYDKNKMEASGYAATLADLSSEPVLLVPFYADDLHPKARFRPDGVLEVLAPPEYCNRRRGRRRSGGSAAVDREQNDVAVVAVDRESDVKMDNGSASCHGIGEEVKSAATAAADGRLQDTGSNVGSPEGNGLPEADDVMMQKTVADEKKAAAAAASEEEEEAASGGRLWVPIRAAVRYVTQRPWTRIPAITRTAIYNPVLACLAGGRNKMLAAKAYDLFNAEMAGTGLCIHTPETIWDVSKREVPLWVQRMGGLAVVKVPYANAGQGVWTITHAAELHAFMHLAHHRYDRFIVQALIGNNGWSSVSHHGRLYHVGTIPNLKGNIYAADLRMMIGSSPEGFFPVAIYARRAKLPLAESLQEGAQSWDMLGTNLSVKNQDGSWGTESERLLLMDSRDFNQIGIGLDDLIEAYMQTVLAVLAIDNLACKLITPKGNFGLKLFQALNPDPKLLAELYVMQLQPSSQIGSENGQSQYEIERKERQSSVSEDVLAEELEKKVEMVTSMVSNSNVDHVLMAGVHAF